KHRKHNHVSLQLRRARYYKNNLTTHVYIRPVSLGKHHGGPGWQIRAPRSLHLMAGFVEKNRAAHPEPRSLAEYLRVIHTAFQAPKHVTRHVNSRECGSRLWLTTIYDQHNCCTARGPGAIAVSPNI